MIEPSAGSSKGRGRHLLKCPPSIASHYSCLVGGGASCRHVLVLPEGVVRVCSSTPSPRSRRHPSRSYAWPLVAVTCDHSSLYCISLGSISLGGVPAIQSQHHHHPSSRDKAPRDDCTLKRARQSRAASPSCSKAAMVAATDSVLSDHSQWTILEKLDCCRRRRSEAPSLRQRTSDGAALIFAASPANRPRAYQNAEELVVALQAPIIKHIDEHVRPPRLPRPTCLSPRQSIIVIARPAVDRLLQSCARIVGLLHGPVYVGK